MSEPGNRGHRFARKRGGLVAAVIVASSELARAGQTRPDWVAGAHPRFFTSYLGLELWQWLGLAGLSVAALFAAWASGLAVKLAINVRDRILQNALSKRPRKLFRRAVAVLVFTWVCYLLIDELYLPKRQDYAIAKFLEALHIVGYVLLASGIWDALSEHLAHRASGQSARAQKLLIPLTSKLVRATIVVTGLLIALATLTSVNLEALIASLGVGGLVVALAAKDSIENVFGTMTILFDMPFAIGDWVKIDKVEGVVEEINLRSTRIRTFEDTIINLPNANLIRAAVENFGARRVRRQKMVIRVSPDNSGAKIAALCTDARAYLKGLAEVQSDRVIVGLDTLDEASLGIFLQCYFEAPTQIEELRLRELVMLELLRLRDVHGVLLSQEGRAAQVARLAPP